MGGAVQDGDLTFKVISKSYLPFSKRNNLLTMEINTLWPPRRGGLQQGDMGVGGWGNGAKLNNKNVTCVRSDNP